MLEEQYENLKTSMRGLLADESDRIANAANFCALTFASMESINWVGFYFLQGKELVVGPFQGPPACVRIAMNRGVCGLAASDRRTVRVADVDAFPDHIPCDSASRSEIVIPLIKDNQLIGVLDIDAPIKNRFSAEDQRQLEAMAAIFLGSLDH